MPVNLSQPHLYDIKQLEQMAEHSDNPLAKAILYHYHKLERVFIADDLEGLDAEDLLRFTQDLNS